MDAGIDMKDHHDSLLKILNAQSKVQTMNQHRAENGDNITEAVAAAINDVSDISAVDLDTHIAKLNKDQSRVFENLCRHFNHQYRHEHNQCVCTDFKPIHMFVSGVGSTGKSFLIETIRAKVAEIWKNDSKNGDIICAVAAPTGLAAYIINGVTASVVSTAN